MFRNRIPVARTSIWDELPLPGMGTMHKRLIWLQAGPPVRTARSSTRYLRKYFGVISQVGCADNPCRGKDIGLTLSSRSFMAFFPPERKRIGRMGKSWAAGIPGSVRVGVQRHQAGCVGCAAELGAGHQPSCGWLTHKQPPLLTRAIQGLSRLIPTHSSSLRAVTVPWQRRNERG